MLYSIASSQNVVVASFWLQLYLEYKSN